MDIEEKLMKEYETNQQTAQSMETPIWITNAAIGLGSIGALITLLSVQQQPPVIAVIALGIFVNLISFFWFKMADRWWSIQHLILERCFHIKLELRELRNYSAGLT